MVKETSFVEFSLTSSSNEIRIQPDQFKLDYHND